MKILVTCCDAYHELAPRCLHFIQESWPDCPHEIEFVTDSVELDVPVKVVYTRRRSLDYGGKLRDWLEQNDDPHVLIVMIDFCVVYVDIPLVNRALDLCSCEGVGRVQLGRPASKVLVGPTHIPGFREILPSDKYSASQYVGIWRSELLLNVARPGFRPWEVETTGSRIMRRMKNRDWLLYATVMPAIYVVNTHRGGVQRVTEAMLPQRVEFIQNIARSHRSGSHSAQTAMDFRGWNVPDRFNNSLSDNKRHRVRPRKRNRNRVLHRQTAQGV